MWRDCARHLYASIEGMKLPHAVLLRLWSFVRPNMLSFQRTLMTDNFPFFLQNDLKLCQMVKGYRFERVQAMTSLRTLKAMP